MEQDPTQSSEHRFGGKNPFEIVPTELPYLGDQTLNPLYIATYRPDSSKSFFDPSEIIQIQNEASKLNKFITQVALKITAREATTPEIIKVKETALTLVFQLKALLTYYSNIPFNDIPNPANVTNLEILVQSLKSVITELAMLEFPNF